jgi:hypothetical protein
MYIIRSSNAALVLPPMASNIPKPFPFLLALPVCGYLGNIPAGSELSSNKVFL